MSRAKALVGCLFIENSGRWRGLYTDKVPKARLEASSPLYELKRPSSEWLRASECISTSVVHVIVSQWLSGNQYLLPLRHIKQFEFTIDVNAENTISQR